MTETVLATAYLPNILYFAIIAQKKKIRIEHHETYLKQTFRNRTTILSANGPLDLTIPIVRTNGNHTQTSEIHIAYSEKWQIRHWRAIVSAYNASPFFLYYQDELEKILMDKHETLMDLNGKLLSLLIKKLKIECEISFTEDYYPILGKQDLRIAISPKKDMKNLALFEPYEQVFSTKLPFEPNLSILDLLFNIGPESRDYLLNKIRLMY